MRKKKVPSKEESRAARPSEPELMGHPGMASEGHIIHFIFVSVTATSNNLSAYGNRSLDCEMFFPTIPVSHNKEIDT